MTKRFCRKDVTCYVYVYVYVYVLVIMQFRLLSAILALTLLTYVRIYEFY